MDEQSKLDAAWEEINALGGWFAQDDLVARGRDGAINEALAIIENLGGMDPLLRRQQKAEV